MHLQLYFFLALFFFAVSLYLVLSPRFAPYLYRPMLFKPLPMDKDLKAPVVNNIAGEDIEIQQCKKIKVHGWLFQRPGAKYTVLVSHGNGGNIASKLGIVEALAKLDVSVFTYDYCGYGKTTGLPNLNNVCQSAYCAYDYLTRTKGVESKHLILYGESLGGAISAELARLLPVGGLIIQSGFISLREIAVEKMPILRIYPSFMFPKPSLDTRRSLAKLQVPVLIVHGFNDPVVPYHHAEKLFEQSRPPKRLVKLTCAGHSDMLSSQPMEFLRQLETFISEIEKLQTT